MKVHNIFEAIVKSSIDGFCNSAAFKKTNFCSCNQCRMDVECYVLNKMPPKYIVSARGVIHRELEYKEKIQEEADVMHLVKKGFQVITDRKRDAANHNEFLNENNSSIYYNFPFVLGKLIDGRSFSPVTKAKINYYYCEKDNISNLDAIAYNVDYNEYTNGIFSFWPHAIEAAGENIEKTFLFKLTVTQSGFENYTKLFELNAVSENSLKNPSYLYDTYNLDDIYLFPVLE